MSSKRQKYKQPQRDLRHLAAIERCIITSVLGELHRHGGMPWFWKLERTLGVSIRDIARTLRDGEVQGSYALIWVNRHVWDRELGREAAL